jgi:hypothetical protein
VSAHTTDTICTHGTRHRVDSIRSIAARYQLSTADRTRIREPTRCATRRRYIHRQPSRYLVHRQGGGAIRRLHPRGHRTTGPRTPGQRTDSDRPMDTSPRGHTRERGPRQGSQGSRRMEGGWLQPTTSRSASPALPTQDNAQKMVQDSGGKTMDKRMERRQERPCNVQARTNAHQEGAAAL